MSIIQYPVSIQMSIIQYPVSIQILLSLCLPLQGVIQYEIVGLYPATQYFYIERESGIIRTYGLIKNDPLQLSSYTVSISGISLQCLGQAYRWRRDICYIYIYFT